VTKNAVPDNIDLFLNKNPDLAKTVESEGSIPSTDTMMAMGVIFMCLWIILVNVSLCEPTEYSNRFIKPNI
jgi:hypothetical protein